MTTRRRARFVRGHIAWMLGVALLLSVLGALTYETFFTLSLLGLLIVTQLTAPVTVTPRWSRRVLVLIGAGLVVFAYILITSILARVPEGVL